MILPETLVRVRKSSLRLLALYCTMFIPLFMITHDSAVRTKRVMQRVCVSPRLNLAFLKR